jgi:integrase
MGLYEGVRAKLDIKEVIAELRNETVRLDQAIAALERLDSYPELSKSPTVRKLLAPAGYVARLPGAVKEGTQLYSTHSLRATTATLLLDAGVDIRKVQELLGHRHVTTTQIYDKRRRTTKESASHDVPI